MIEPLQGKKKTPWRGTMSLITIKKTGSSEKLLPATNLRRYWCLLVLPSFSGLRIPVLWVGRIENFIEVMVIIIDSRFFYLPR